MSPEDIWFRDHVAYTPDGARLDGAELYRSYHDWFQAANADLSCADEDEWRANGMFSPNLFTRWLLRCGFKSSRANGRRVWPGLRLTSPTAHAAGILEKLAYIEGAYDRLSLRLKKSPDTLTILAAHMRAEAQARAQLGLPVQSVDGFEVIGRDHPYRGGKS